MAGLGIHLRQDWIAHCFEGQYPHAGGPQSAKEDIYRIFLACDLREAGEACLPTGVADMVKDRIKGRMVVQVSVTNRALDTTVLIVSYRIKLYSGVLVPGMTYEIISTFVFEKKIKNFGLRYPTKMISLACGLLYFLFGLLCWFGRYCATEVFIVASAAVIGGDTRSRCYSHIAVLQ